MGFRQYVPIFESVGQRKRENVGQFVDLGFDFGHQRLQLLVEVMAVTVGRFEQLRQGRGLSVGKQPREQFGQMKDLCQCGVGLLLR